MAERYVCVFAVIHVHVCAGEVCICTVHERGTVKMKAIPFGVKKRKEGVRRKYKRQSEKEREKERE